MDRTIPIGHELVELLTNQLFLSDFDQLAETTTGIIYDQLEHRDILLPTLQRQPFQLL